LVCTSGSIIDNDSSEFWPSVLTTVLGSFRNMTRTNQEDAVGLRIITCRKQFDHPHTKEAAYGRGQRTRTALFYSADRAVRRPTAGPGISTSGRSSGDERNKGSILDSHSGDERIDTKFMQSQSSGPSFLVHVLTIRSARITGAALVEVLIVDTKPQYA
jgi:hypothetical protein